MTPSTNASKPRATPYSDALPNNGVMTIFVSLVIGGALIVGVFILWQQHEQKIVEAKASMIEEEVRTDILSVYRLLRAECYAEALEKLAATREKVEFLRRDSQALEAYSDFRVVMFILTAEAEFAQNPAKNAADAEKKFDSAILLLHRASGEVWEFGVLGRARTRFEQGKYDEAARDLDTLVGGNPNYGAAYYWRSLARERLGDREGAILDRAMAENLDSWPPLRDPLSRSEAKKLNIFREN